MGRAIGVTGSWHGDTADAAMHCYPKLSDRGGGGGNSSRLRHFGRQETYSHTPRCQRSDVLTCWKVDEQQDWDRGGRRVMAFPPLHYLWRCESHQSGLL